MAPAAYSQNTLPSSSVPEGWGASRSRLATSALGVAAWLGQVVSVQSVVARLNSHLIPEEGGRIIGKPVDVAVVVGMHGWPLIFEYSMSLLEFFEVCRR